MRKKKRERGRESATGGRESANTMVHNRNGREREDNATREREKKTTILFSLTRTPVTRFSSLGPNTFTFSESVEFSLRADFA